MTMRHDIASILYTARFLKALTVTPNGLCRVNSLEPNKRSYTYIPLRRNTVLTVFRAMPELASVSLACSLAFPQSTLRGVWVSGAASTRATSSTLARRAAL